jgi:MtN3 and saliva related transmembrane protein
MELIGTIGIAAATLTTIAGLPQLIRIIKLRETRDLSLEMYILLCTGILLWLIYGLMKNDMPLILGNIVSLVISLTILGFKLKYK